MRQGWDTMRFYFEPDEATRVAKCLGLAYISHSAFFVTVDAEAFFFLHDLISSYIKEREKFVSSQSSAGASGHSPHPGGDLLTPDSAAVIDRSSPSTSDKSPGSGEPDKTGDADKKSLPISSDWRIFECKTWHLEPTVRLQSWAGKKIEPYGVDYILQKLGFSHAKTTIPKWMQVWRMHFINPKASNYF